MLTSRKSRKPIGIYLCIAAGLFTGCQNTTAMGGSELDPQYRYYSDYFVFIGKNPDYPVIVPLDVNWEWRGADRVFREVKAWWGTEENWTYDALVKPARVRVFPETWQEVPGGRGFSWSSARWRIDVGNQAGRFTLLMDSFEGSEKKQSAIEEPRSGGFKILRVGEGRIEIGDRTIEGYVIHEQIRASGQRKITARPPFGRFTWIPLVAEDQVFLFTTRGENKSLIHWSREGTGFTGDRRLAYELIETRTETETVSGRRDVPAAWRITVPELDLTFDFEGKSHHTGYGDPAGGRRPLYRQQLAQGRARIEGSGRSFAIHGMIELILED
jgi:hypothetical protein